MAPFVSTYNDASALLDLIHLVRYSKDLQGCTVKIVTGPDHTHKMIETNVMQHILSGLHQAVLGTLGP